MVFYFTKVSFWVETIVPACILATYIPLGSPAASNVTL